MAEMLNLEEQFAIVSEAEGPPPAVRVLKHNDTFAVFDANGDIVPGPGSPYGLYHLGTRFLSRFELRLGNRAPSTLAYQSKLGPIAWLGPPTIEEIRALGRRGQKQVLAVPIAFVTDHVETLYEIDQLFGDEARRAGIADFRRTPGLNAHPTFLRALVEIVEAQTDFWAP